MHIHAYVPLPGPALPDVNENPLHSPCLCVYMSVRAACAYIHAFLHVCTRMCVHMHGVSIDLDMKETSKMNYAH